MYSSGVADLKVVESFVLQESEEFEVFDSEWCVYSWDNGDKIEPMHPHDALILELKGKTLVNMTDKHGMRPAHLKMLERKEQMERWENV